MTVSNLSQAIRFLVDNDFLDGVEMKPGEADQQAKIEVLESSDDVQMEDGTSGSTIHDKLANT